MCGIFGVITNDVNKVDLTKVHMLGVMNEDRGIDSCGLFLDGVIYAGFEKKLSTYRNFALTMNMQPEKYPFVLGHTRQASVGAAITINNVHPFGFGYTKKNGFKMVGAHNGTLYNKEALAEEFKVELKDGERVKIDSEILLECIFKNKSFKVLEKYHGAAALSFIDLVKNKMYLYSGASGEYSPTKPELERPLHVYMESDDVLYYSSEELPLLLLGGDETNVFQIDNNQVYEFTPGDFNNYVKYPIDRSKMTQKKDYYSGGYRYGGYSKPNYGNYGNYGDFDDWEDAYLNKSSSLDVYHNLINKDNHTVFKRVEYAYYKSIPPLNINSEKGITYTLGGKYYTNDLDSKNSSFSNGIYIYFEDLGYYKIADKAEELRTNLKMLDDNFFNMKTLKFEFEESNIDWRGNDSAYFDYFTVPDKVMQAIKSNVALDDEVFSEYLHFFFEGTKLKSHLDYLFCLNKKPSFKELSHMTSEVMLSNENTAWKDGTKFTGEFENIYYTYIFKDGKCEKVKLKEKIKSFTILNYRYE